MSQMQNSFLCEPAMTDEQKGTLMREELKACKQSLMDIHEMVISAVGYGAKSTSPKSAKPCKYVWMVHGDNPCDIRRYAYSHQDAINMVATKGGGDGWTLYKLVRVNKRKA